MGLASIQKESKAYSSQKYKRETNLRKKITIVKCFAFLFCAYSPHWINLFIFYLFVYSLIFIYLFIVYTTILVNTNKEKKIKKLVQKSKYYIPTRHD